MIRATYEGLNEIDLIQQQTMAGSGYGMPRRSPDLGLETEIRESRDYRAQATATHIVGPSTYFYSNCMHLSLLLPSSSLSSPNCIPKKVNLLLQKLHFHLHPRYPGTYVTCYASYFWHSSRLLSPVSHLCPVSSSLDGPLAPTLAPLASCLGCYVHLSCWIGFSCCWLPCSLLWS